MSKKMPRVLMITSHFHPQISGVANHVLKLATELTTRHGYEVEVLAPDFGGEYSGEGTVNGCVYYKHLRSLALSPSFCIPIESLPESVRCSCYDIIHVHSYLSLLPLMLSFNRWLRPPDSKCKYVLTPHYHPQSTASLTKLLRIPYDFLFKSLIFRSFDGIVLLTEFERAILAEVLGSKCHTIIPNGVDLDELESKPRDSSIGSPLFNQNQPYLTAVYCGNLLKYKGVQNLLRAVSILAKENVVVQVRVVGDGPYRPRLAKLATSLGIESQVRFLGFLPRREQISIVEASDVLVLPSEYEAFGIVLLEAMALGKAVIATSRGGPPSLGIPSDYLVDYGDFQKLASALKRLAMRRTERLELGARYALHVRARYTWERIGDQTARFYEHLATTGSPQSE